MRPPRGEYSEKVLYTSDKLNYKTVFWSFAYQDYDINNQKGPILHIKWSWTIYIMELSFYYMQFQKIMLKPLTDNKRNK